MASKLFRAVVGFGIGLGATSAACFGATDGGGTVGTFAEIVPDGSTSSTAPAPSSTGTGTPDLDAGPPADASIDVNVVDASVDAPKDVGVDAFCDAAWPTTKGNPGPPKCVDPNGECADAGHPHLCVAVDDAGACDWSSFQTTAPFCVNAEWRCSAGTASIAECQ